MAGGGEEFGGVEELGSEGVVFDGNLCEVMAGTVMPLSVAEALEAGLGEDGGVEVGLFGDFLEAGGDVAPDVDDVEVGAEAEELEFAADGGGADGRAGWELGEGGAVGDEDVAGGSAREDGADFKIGFEDGGDVLEGVNGEVDGLVEEGEFEFFDEDAFVDDSGGGGNLGEGDVGALVAGGDDDLAGEVAAAGEGCLGHFGLVEGEGGAAGTEGEVRLGHLEVLNRRSQRSQRFLFEQKETKVAKFFNRRKRRERWFLIRTGVYEGRSMFLWCSFLEVP